MQQESQIRAFAPSLVSRHVPPESPKAAAVYANYEALGDDRSLVKLIAWYQERPTSDPNAKKYIPAITTLKRWSSWYNWQQRIKAYEEKQLEERRKERQKERDAMDKRHMGYGRSSLYEAIMFISKHLNDEEIFINHEGKQEKKSRTTISQAAHLMKISYELERLAMGAATERIEGDMTITILPKEYINLDPNEEGSEP